MSLHHPMSKKLNRADVILINGLTFESWLTKLINNISEEKKIVLLTKNIAPITSTEHKGATDPHAWMDVENGISYALEICKALQKTRSIS
jgi:ABC-type Zn uptake system ZnuABC Zn-binding protein ZnuA